MKWLILLAVALAGCGGSGAAPSREEASAVRQQTYPDYWSARLAAAVRVAGPSDRGQAHEEAALLARGRNAAPLISLLQERLTPGGNADPATYRLQSAAAMQLAALDYTRERVIALEQAGVPVVEAVQASAQGRATFLQRAILSPNVAIVEAVAPAGRADLADGFATSARIRIVETLKGDLAPGRELLLRQVSLQGAEPRKRDVFDLQPGRRYLVHISNAAYRHWALSRGFPPALDPNIVINQLPPRLVGEDTIMPLAPDPALSLAEARRLIAPVAAAQRRVFTAILPRSSADPGELWLTDLVDGKPVVPTRYWVRVHRGVVTGGYDACNWWGRSLHRGQFAIESTLVGCPDDPVRNAYSAALMGPEPGGGVLQPDGSLRVGANGHVLILRRPLD